MDDVAGVYAEASSRLRRMVPFDAAVWVSTDPATGLATAPTLTYNIDSHDSDRCSVYWHREVLNEDVNLFRDLARAEIPAAALRSATSDPCRSARYRKFLRPEGIEDELRAVLRVDESPWATVTLMRNKGQPHFSRLETSLMGSLSAPLGEALRVRARPSETTEGFTGNERPGLMLFDRSGNLLSVNEEARTWLAELPSDPGRSSDLGLRVPLWISGAVFHAQEGHDGTARARVRTRRGRWLVCHASSLRNADGEPGNTALVIEPAKSSEMAPIIAQAYDLTEREQQVTSLIARGAGTTEIAEELFLSSHTIRDHVKTVFQKAGVTSRGELVAKLFAEHYGPEHHHELASVFDD
jgi:DNA-binding CsgD family transcriptional regulator